ncbi:effector-associated constant component EACC1 [Saccharopolyspora taberi]|uniref:Uncharacterized protein n=1 Tax=Saccharopolyspora taberi TaxID=60895 RepID=A0ABN3VHK8_9PSEU
MIEARINIEEPTVSPQRLHQMHDQLMRDLRSVRGIEVRRSREDAPPDSKSGVGAQLAELIVTGTLSGGTGAAVTQVITALINRSASRSVTIKKADGQELTVTGASPEVQRRLTEMFAEDKEEDRRAER